MKCDNWQSTLVRIACGMLLFLVCIGAGQPARACDTPVFIYAVENWSSDPYDIFIFHKGVLSPDDQKIVKVLRDNSLDGSSPANTLVTSVDLATQPEEKLQKLYDRQHAAMLPWVAIYYPLRSVADETGETCAVPENEQKLFWSGPLRDLPVAALLDSPVRRTIARQLLRKDTIVWVLLESGNRKKDNAAATLLQAELAKLEETIVVSAPAAYFEEHEEPPKVHFSVVRLSRSAPQERMLTRMFLHSEEGIADRKDPLVFPIYGRGIVLYALAGAGINAANLREAAEFLVGPCSCEVKESNPGVELLITLDWDRYIIVENLGDLPAPAGLAGFAANAEKAKKALAAPPAKTGKAAKTPIPPKVKTTAKSVSPPAAMGKAPPAKAVPAVTDPAPAIPVKPEPVEHAPAAAPSVSQPASSGLLARNLIILGLVLIGCVVAATVIIKFQRRSGERPLS